jgi:endo-1,4-beta-xylanase
MKKSALLLLLPLATVGASVGLSQPREWHQGTSGVQGVTPLKDAFKGKFAIGAAISTGMLRGAEPEAEKLVKTHFSSITAENAMKPAEMQPREGEFVFTESDKLVALAESAGAEWIPACPCGRRMRSPPIQGWMCCARSIWTT